MPGLASRAIAPKALNSKRKGEDNMWTRIVLTAALVVTVRALPAVAQPVDCEPSRCAAQAALDGCGCDTASNHGRYVSCVAHAVNTLAKQRSIDVRCKGKIRRCAARSICGKVGFVTCNIPTDTCDLTTGFCTADPTVACTADIDCGSVCRIKSSSDLCLASGGQVGTGATCCTAASCPQ